jgi:hypothetical protein
MHLADEPCESRDLTGGWVHKFVCPRCRAASSRPEDVFVVHAGAVVPRSDYVLFATECRTCGLFRDAAIWCGAPEMELGEEADDAGGVALLGRYQTLVEQHRQALLRVEPTTLGPACHVDHSAEPIQVVKVPLVAIGAGLLAAARGLRRGVAARPGVGNLALLCAGHLNATLSLNATPDRPLPYAFHVGMSNRHESGLPTEGEMEGGAAPSLRSRRTGRRHLHIYLATDLQGVLAC